MREKQWEGGTWALAHVSLQQLLGPDDVHVQPASTGQVVQGQQEFTELHFILRNTIQWKTIKFHTYSSRTLTVWDPADSNHCGLGRNPNRLYILACSYAFEQDNGKYYQSWQKSLGVPAVSVFQTGFYSFIETGAEIKTSHLWSWCSYVCYSLQSMISIKHSALSYWKGLAGGLK